MVIQGVSVSGCGLSLMFGWKLRRIPIASKYCCWKVVVGEVHLGQIQGRNELCQIDSNSCSACFRK